MKNSKENKYWCYKVMRYESFKAGEDVITFGEKGDKFYIVFSG